MPVDISTSVGYSVLDSQSDRDRQKDRHTELLNELSPNRRDA